MYEACVVLSRQSSVYGADRMNTGDLILPMGSNSCPCMMIVW